MASSSNKRYTQLDFDRRGANSFLASSGTLGAQGTEDSPNLRNDKAPVNLRARKEQYSNQETKEIAKTELFTPTNTSETIQVATTDPSGALHPSTLRFPVEVEDDGAGDVHNKGDFNLNNGPRSEDPAVLERQDAPVKVKAGSPWETFEQGYELRVGGLVTIARRKRPLPKVPVKVAIRKLSGSGRDMDLRMLLLVKGKAFTNCTEVYEFGNEIYTVLDYMPISLIQIVTAPPRRTEAQLAAVFAQLLRGLQFLEVKDLSHGNITCSTILLNDRGLVKIGMQECCTAVLGGNQTVHPDVQALGDVMMQFLEGCGKGEGPIQANCLPRWSPRAQDFWSTIPSASAKELMQHAFLKGWDKDDLILLVAFAQVTSRRFYTLG